MDDFNVIFLAAAVAAAFQFSIILSITWFLLYAGVGTWIKGRFCVLENTEKKYKRWMIPHLLFSVIFMNPWLVCWGYWNLMDTGSLPEWLFFIFLCIYTWLFSLLVDWVCIRLASKLKIFRFMACNLCVRRYIWIQLFLVIAGLGLGYGLAFIVVRVF